MSQEQLGTRNFVQIGLFGGIFWGGIWYFLHIFHLRKLDRIISFYHLRLGLEGRGMGNVLGVVCMGLLSILIAFCIKHFCKI